MATFINTDEIKDKVQNLTFGATVVHLLDWNDIPIYSKGIDLNPSSEVGRILKELLATAYNTAHDFISQTDLSTSRDEFTKAFTRMTVYKELLTKFFPGEYYEIKED